MSHNSKPNSKGFAGRLGLAIRRDTLENAIGVVLSLLTQSAPLTGVPDLKSAAGTTLFILTTIQSVKENKEGFQRLAEDVAALFLVIWGSHQKCKDPQNWLTPELREILLELQITLDSIETFVRGQLERGKRIRFIYSKADSGKIQEYRERLGSAMNKFELQSHIIINEALIHLQSEQERLLDHLEHQNNKGESGKGHDLAKKLLEAEAIRESEIEELKRLRAEEAEWIRKKAVRESNAKKQAELKDDLERLKAEKARREALLKLEATRAEIERLKSEKKRRAEAAQIKEEENRRQAEEKVQREAKAKQKARVEEVEDEDDYDEWEEDDSGEDTESQTSEEGPPVRVHPNAVGSTSSSKPAANPPTDANSLNAQFGRMNMQGNPGAEPHLHSQPHPSQQPSPAMHTQPHPFQQPTPAFHHSATHPLYTNPHMAHMSHYPYGPPSYGYPAHSAPNIGIMGGYFSGNARPIINQNSGNTSNVSISDVGNNNSRNYYDREFIFSSLRV
ncbi:hypothetical protein B0H34DRAFT_279613 [Crassisporium funariophilum]|nr:hypothetical protein B0H34DRAFT_279613 [Crassisporium funariophilum]